jgi:hypothetical protein
MAEVSHTKLIDMQTLCLKGLNAFITGKAVKFEDGTNKN